MNLTQGYEYYLSLTVYKYYIVPNWSTTLPCHGMSQKYINL